MITDTSVRPADNVVTAHAHLAYLDSLRALAALYVMMSHIVITVWPSWDSLHGAALLLAGPFLFGHYAVGLFIVLSGFSLMLTGVSRESGELKLSARRFYLRRSRRILPPYYAALGLSLAACLTLIGRKTGTSWDVSLPVTSSGVLTHLLLIHDFRHAAQIDPPLWSICVEWRIYFLFPLLVLWFRKSGGVWVAIAMSILSFLAYLACRHTVFTCLMPIYCALFTFGMLACEIGYGRLAILRERVPWSAIQLPLFALFVALAWRWQAGNTNDQTLVLDCLVGLLSAGLLILSSRRSMLQRLLSVPWLAWLGTFAYSIYLIHMPLLHICWQYGVMPLHLPALSSYMAIVVVGVPVILAACYGFFLACERPFLNAKTA